MIVIYFFGIIFFLIAWKIIYNKRLNISYIKSSIDNQYYLVRNEGNKQIAANFLAEIRNDLINLCLYISDNYKEYENVNIDEINRFFYRLHPDNIIEAPDDKENTSYCINKGEEIAICLRHKNDNNKLHIKNTIIYVILHELSHVMSVTIGHNDEFMTNFKFLLKAAIDAKIWKKINYSKYPVEYCGITINEYLLD